MDNGMATIDKQTADEALTAKVAAMGKDESVRRVFEIADSEDQSPEALQEFVKLLFGPDATISEE